MWTRRPSLLDWSFSRFVFPLARSKSIAKEGLDYYVWSATHAGFREYVPVLI
jgi:hypothetical protein